jgi:hypothetical protein
MQADLFVTHDLPPMPGQIAEGPPPLSVGESMPQVGVTVPEYIDTSDDPRYQPKVGDEKLYIVFHKKTVQNWPESRRQQRPIFKEVDYVRIHIPGDRFNVQDIKVTPPVASRFKEKYQRWLKTQDNDHVDGTPLEQWPGVTRSQVEELKHFHVRTVEQLAQMADSLGQQYMGFFQLREAARKFLDDATSNDTLKKENDVLKQQIAALAARMDALAPTDKAGTDDNAVHSGTKRSR